MIIGFTGLIGAGKDTSAAIIKKFDPSYEIKSFADRLKDMTAALYGWDRSLLQGNTPESRLWREQEDSALSALFNRTITPRNQLQHLGFCMKSVLAPDVWAIFLKDEIQRKGLKNVLIPDVRSAAEIEMVRSLGGIILRVQRGPVPDWFSLAEEFNIRYPQADALPEKGSVFEKLCAIHPTEWKWIGFDQPTHIIENHDTLDALNDRVIAIFKRLSNR